MTRLITFIVFILFSTSALAQVSYELPRKGTGELFIEFRARSGVNPDKGNTGHAFLIIGERYGNGTIIYEDAAGFYPKDGKFFPILEISLPRAVGEGKLDYKIQDIGPYETFRVNISESQKRTINFIMKKRWGKSTYILGSNDCVSFVNDIAKYLNLNTPKFSSDPIGNLFPLEYIKSLEKLNKNAAQKVIQMEKWEIEASRRTKFEKEAPAVRKSIENYNKRKSLPSGRGPQVGDYSPNNGISNSGVASSNTGSNTTTSPNTIMTTIPISE